MLKQQIVDIFGFVVYNKNRKVMGLNLILYTVTQEKQRIEYMLAKYQSELSAYRKAQSRKRWLARKHIII